MRHRLEAQKVRTDMHGWMAERRARTKHLIELGGLIVKAGLVDLTDDDRATIYGALLMLANTLRGPELDHALALWKRKGRRAFEVEEISKQG